jgi:hypothetical protein
MQRSLFAAMIAVMIAGAAPARETRLRASAPPAKESSEQEAGLSKAEYVRLLVAEIRRHSPRTANVFTGSAEVVFTIGASGRVVDYKLESVTNRRQVEPVVQGIMAAIQTPPPPGGSFEARQQFRFTDESRRREQVDYLRVVFSAMEKRKTRALTPHGAIAIFHVDETGRVDEVKIARASSPKQAQIAYELLYGLKAPPPPYGQIHLKACFAEGLDHEKRAPYSAANCEAFDPGAI